jgi:hypothetical protein
MENVEPQLRILFNKGNLFSVHSSLFQFKLTSLGKSDGVHLLLQL